MNELEKSILKTIIYFDIFNYPMTVFEIWKYLYNYQCELIDVVKCLSNGDNIKRYIETKDGLYFLKGKKELIYSRKSKRDSSIFKIQIIKKVVCFLRFIPFIKMIAISGSIGYFNAKEDSDIDIFIIIKGGYVWLARFFITLSTHLSGKRRHGKKIKNRVCLNFYISDNAMDLECLAYENDIWFAYWLLTVVPIFDLGIYGDFYNSNKWVNKLAKNHIKHDVAKYWKVNDNIFSKNIRRFIELLLNSGFGRLFNSFLKGVQLLKMKQNKNSKMNNGDNSVVVNDFMLKFHENDMRAHYNKMFFDRIKFLS